MESYKALQALFFKRYKLSHLLALGSWDMQTMMPPKGITTRAAALGELEELLHKMIVSAETKKLLDEALTAEAELEVVDRANLREMKLIYDAAATLPVDFTSRKASVASESQSVWTKARAENNFDLFLPKFRQCVEIAREEARHRSAATGKGLYESLFHMYEPGMSLQSVEEIFASLKSWLPALLKSILESRKKIDKSIVPVEYPIDTVKQEALVREMMKLWEFDFDAGRLDLSAHPFCGMVKEDTRVTIHYDVNSFQKGLFAGIHETGHSRYEANCGPLEMRGQPVCEARSMSVHESQSRFAEVTVGRSGAFAAFLIPYLKKHFGDQPAFDEENMKKVNQHVEPGYIRVEADEVCYPLHILLRYEIERALVEGTLEAEDVPRVWNEKMSEYLGLDTTGKDNLGCLQDVHWSASLIGYFPTYTLGSMFAAQLMATIKKELGEETVQKCIRNGDLSPIFAKQKEKIWDNGCLFLTEELMIKATGEKLNAKYFQEYLEKRYLRNED